MMSDDGCCGNMENCCNETEAECDYTGGYCDDSAPCMDNYPYEETSTNIETSYSDCVDVCDDPQYGTYSCNVDYDIENGNESTYRPVYSNLSVNNNTGKRNSTECAIISMMNFRRYYAQKREREYESRLKWILAIGFVLFICKINVMIFL